MKKTLSLIFALLLLISSGAAAADSVAKIKKAGILKAGVKEDVPKFGFLNPKTNKHEGFEIELASLVAKKLLGDASKVKYTGVTAKTRGPLLDTGELDMVAATFTITPERRQSYEFSDTYFTDGVGVMVKKAANINSFKDLNGKTIGVAQSATSRKAIQTAADAAGIKVKFAEYSTYPELKASLDSKRIQAFSVDKAILMGYMEDSVKILSETFDPQEYGIAIKKGNTDLLEIVNGIIRDLQKSGEMEKLLKKHQLK
ncbi:MAG: transporter substrate-binding domain-containing protein [Elusimicrobiota bacterium]|jgi:putative glutamine transport system substrate-binding protein|nr:transporter substrate-binding domain-containing protein [Elusimicrobiota bacterium]